MPIPWSHRIRFQTRETSRSVDVQVNVDGASWGFWSFYSRTDAARWIREARKSARLFAPADPPARA